MTHVFVGPHADDVALSCGGLVASLRELGQNVTILTVFSGAGPAAEDPTGDGLSTYQRESLAGQPVMDALSTQGAVATDELVDAADAGELMARRRLEDETFAAFAEASIVFLDLPDAVFRGYANDEELLNSPRDSDAAPYEILRREIARLEPQRLYLPLGVGNHVDHQLCRDVGVRMLAEGRRWVMPGVDYSGIITFYEDFPYAWWNDFGHISDLPR